MTLSTKTFFILSKMIITSRQNSKIIHAVKLAEKKYRNAYGQYVIEGERLVCDAAVHGADIIELFVAQSKAQKLGVEVDNPTFGTMFNVINDALAQLPVSAVADDVFAKMSDTVNSQGVIAVVRKPMIMLSAPKGNCLVLDGIQDPGNAGTLIRTAAACGFTDVFAVNSVDLYSPKVLRSAMSAHFCVKISCFDDIGEAFDLLCNTDIIAADMHGDAIVSANFEKPVSLVVGNEGNGISDYTKANADRILSLPMQNNFESLNAGVAGSVMMYQIFFKQNKFIK